MKRGAVLLFTAALVALVMAVGIAERPTHAAAPFTVNSTADTGDAIPDGACSSTCTLREAIQEANFVPGADTINFAISGAGPHTITPSSALPDITAPVTIDGYTQGDGTPGDPSDDATENTMAVGNNAVLKIELSGTSMPSPPADSLVSGLKITASNSTVKGLAISKWDEENAVFLEAGATGNKVQGNYIGTNASGTQALGNNSGVVLQGSNNTLGGTTAAARNIISDNGAGVYIVGPDNKVQGNYIGTKANGIEPLGNTNGVVIDAAPDNTIGGTTATARNVISGNSTFGIRIAFPGADNNKVQGNYIGTDVNGTVIDPDGIPNNGDELGNGLDGVAIQLDADDNTIGGTTAGAGNIISGNGVSGNGGDGVEVHFTVSDPDEGATGNRILSNSIYDNAALGIDLVHSNDPAGVTLNDEDDPEPGPNNLQNFPVINSARLTTRRIGGHRRKVTIIKGTLNSEADKTYNVQFFGSLKEDPSGNGEGKTFLGQKSVITNDGGDASFTFQTRKKVPTGQVVTATATNKSTGDTSEFSKACMVPGVPCP
jgi:trimeric autotransporter adhesin